MFETINTFLLVAILVIQILHVVPFHGARPTIWFLILLGIGGANYVSWVHVPSAFPDVVLAGLGILAIGIITEAVIEHRTSKKMMREAKAAYEQRLARGEVKAYVPSQPQPEKPKELNWLHWLTGLTLPFIIVGGMFVILAPAPSPMGKWIAGILALAALVVLPFALRVADRLLDSQKDTQGQV